MGLETLTVSITLSTPAIQHCVMCTSIGQLGDGAGAWVEGPGAWVGFGSVFHTQVERVTHRCAGHATASRTGQLDCILCLRYQRRGLQQQRRQEER